MWDKGFFFLPAVYFWWVGCLAGSWGGRGSEVVHVPGVSGETPEVYNIDKSAYFIFNTPVLPPEV